MSKAGWGLKKSNQDKERSNTLSIETGATVILHHNALDQLAAIVSSQGTLHTNQFPSSYGPQSNPSIPSDLLTYAQSLSWHSQSQDPTGLIWMGARYYDPKGGRFLSPDPVGYPLCLDLYVYAGGDPVNYMDPDGRFFSSTYQTLKSTVLSVWHNPCFQGGVQAFGGLSEAGFGAGMTFATGGVAASLGWPIMVHGLDHFVTGMRTAITGRYGETASVQLLQKTGLSHQTANLLDSGLSMGGAMGGAAIIRPAHSGVLLRLTEPQSLQTGVHITEDWAQLSGILKRASQGKGNFGLGAATREQSNAMGKAWVGEGYRISSDRTAWVSTDGMRQYRPPSIKGKLGKVQANFERKFEGQTWNSWPSNGHLDILD